jgi:hypothetical protein
MRAEIKFKTYNEAVSHVKWLRANLNNRGDDYEFCFSAKSITVTVMIKDQKIATWYRLAFPKAIVRE